MSYKTLMVHVQLGRSNAALLEAAATLAERFHASVIGIAADQPTQMVYGDGYMLGDVVEIGREEGDEATLKAEAEFRSALSTCGSTLEWRSARLLGPISEYVARESRSADLILTASPSEASLNVAWRMETGDLVMRAGRPVIIVPELATTFKADRVVIAWTDTREARRAVFDALPILQKAAYVAVIEIAAEEELEAVSSRLQDVIRWLESHGVNALSSKVSSTRDDSFQLRDFARQRDANLVVAGAYGHSRLREWVLGGVTRDLLSQRDCCTFMSH